MPPPSRSRRRLSRSIPWYLPVGALVIGLVLVLVIIQGVRAVWQPTESIAAPSPTLTTTEGTSGGVSSSGSLAGADPLLDPSLSTSTLDDASVMTFLLLGTDGREQEDGPPRTDLVMVAVADRTRQRLTLISIPRDLWVPIPGYGEGKVNTAYFLGALDGDGISLAKETVEGLVGFELDYFVTVDFEGFRAIVDAMGGITVNVPEPIDDPDYPDYNFGTFRLEIPAGEQTMDGETALRYARTRYGGTDIDRATRQQLVLMAVREKAMQPEQIALAPIHLRTLYREVESNLSLSDFFALARFGRELQRDHIQMHTINGDLTYPTITWNGQDALLYDPAEVEAQILEWLESAPAP
jgi:LCP family protein required for cell wall assembly